MPIYVLFYVMVYIALAVVFPPRNIHALEKGGRFFITSMTDVH